MTLEEAEKYLKQHRELLAVQHMTRTDVEALLMLIEEVRNIREFLYARMGELP